MIKHFLGEKTLTVVVGNRPRAIDREHPFYGEILAGVSDPKTDEAWLLDLLDPLNPLRDVKIDGESIVIEQTTVTRNGEPLPNYLQERIVDTVRAGLPVDGWKLFVERVYANPSFQARDELAKFMEKSGLTMTPDGKFVAFKRVNEDYTSIHANPDGTHLDNSIGRTVVMPGGRRAVDDNRNRTCSNGLHVCSQAYLREFYAGTGRIVIVEVDPADVVSVPYDYNNTKARVWRYTVVGEVPLSTETEAKEWGVISLDYLNRDALELVEANIERIQTLIEGAEASGDETEQAEQEEALSQAIALKVRIENKLAEDQRIADDAYAAQINAELDAAEAAAAAEVDVDDDQWLSADEAIEYIISELGDGASDISVVQEVNEDGELESTLTITFEDEVDLDEDDDYDGPAIWGGFVYDEDDDPEVDPFELEDPTPGTVHYNTVTNEVTVTPAPEPERLTWGERLRRKIGR